MQEAPPTRQESRFRASSEVPIRTAELRTLSKPTTAPGVRAAYMKNLFHELEQRGQLGMLAEHDAALLHDVNDAPRTTWLPVSINVRAVEAICAGLGEDRGLALLAECVYAQFETPLWRSFIAPAVRMLGKEPASLARWIPGALQIVFRGCGEWTVEGAGPAELTVRARALPTEIASHRVWLRSLGIGMGPLFTICGCDGSADLARMDPATRSATYRLAWTARAGS